MSEDKSKNLEDQPWYHGLRPRKDILSLLAESGEWLVRSTDSRQITEIVLSVKDKKKEPTHYTLKYENNKWFLAAYKNTSKAPKFDTVVDLVEYYKDLLGSGNFCKVYKGTYEREKHDVVPVAIKICHGASTDSVTEEAKKTRESMIHEAHIMSYYVHRHIIQLHGVACDHYPVMIVMEFCPGGNLQEHLIRHKAEISVPELMSYASEASRGMRYLHSKGCVHRDLAARNCLISENGLIKISDFGLSKIVEELETRKKDDEEPPIEQIPLRWMAPETLKRPQIWSNKSDVWSFGVLLYEIFNDGVKPWPDDNVKRIATHIRKGRMPKIPQRTPPQVQEMMEKIWSINVDNRPSMDLIAKKLKDLCKLEYRILDLTTLTIKKNKSYTKSETFVVKEAKDDSDSFPKTPVATRVSSRIKPAMHNSHE